MDNYYHAVGNADASTQQWNASHQAAGGAIASQQLNATKQACIRERVQEANKRAVGIAASLLFLDSAVSPSSALAGVGKDHIDTVKVSTLSTDVGDLLRTLIGIEESLSRLSSAIAG